MAARLISDTSQSLESLVAAATGATGESCRTALLLADGDINHAAELILSGVVATDQAAPPAPAPRPAAVHQAVAHREAAAAAAAAAATGATEESCRTALLLADGDINHAAELILSGVVAAEQPAAPLETQPAAVLGQATTRKNTAKHDRQRRLTSWRMPMPPDASYTSLVDRSMQPRCGLRSNLLVGRLLLAMLMHPRLGEHSAAASVVEDLLCEVGEQLWRLHPPRELLEELARRSLEARRGQPGNELMICWRRDDQRGRLSRLMRTCDVNGTDTAGFSPLYRAVSNGDAVAVEAMARRGANINGVATANRWQFTPLMEAARKRDVQMVELLLQLGASKNAVDHRGRTAQQIARLGAASGPRCTDLQHLDDMLAP